MSGKKSRNKGYRGELEFRKLVESYGLAVTWQAEDRIKPDINIEGILDCEIKYRANVPVSIYNWLNEKNSHMLAIKRVSMFDKGCEWLITMPAELLLPVLKEYFGR